MTSNINKKRKYTDCDLNGESLNHFCEDFNDKLSITKIYKKKKIVKESLLKGTNTPIDNKLSIRVKDLNVNKCSVHNNENVCLIYDCPGISIKRYEDNYKSHLEKFDFYS